MVCEVDEHERFLEVGKVVVKSGLFGDVVMDMSMPLQIPTGAGQLTII
jgi:hypothetical protein